MTERKSLCGNCGEEIKFHYNDQKTTVCDNCNAQNLQNSFYNEEEGKIHCLSPAQTGKA